MISIAEAIETNTCPVCGSMIEYRAWHEYSCDNCGCEFNANAEDIEPEYKPRTGGPGTKQGSSPWQAYPPKQNQCGICQCKVGSEARKLLRPTGPLGQYQTWPICDSCLEWMM